MVLVILRSDSDAAAPGGFAESLVVESTGENQARRRTAQATEYGDECGLAAARVALKQHEITAFNCKTASLQDRLVSALMSEHNILCVEDGA